MGISFLLKGLIIGFIIALPVGPIGVLCIRRTLTEGRVSGFVSGLGSATSDAIYGGIAKFGLAFILNFLINQQFWLRLVGGVFLCYLGIRTFLSNPADRVVSARSNGFIGAYTSTFFLAIINPMIILTFIAIFAGLGIATESGNCASAGVLVTGLFSGSALWWFLLSRGVSIFRVKFNSCGLQWINRISSVIITTFGVIVLLSLIRG